MIHVAIERITAADIQALVEHGVRESRSIEYKSTLPGGTDADKKEFLADVASFANAAGGDIVYGVAAADGVPTEAIGLASFNPDADALRLASIVRDGIDPRIPGLRFQLVEGLEAGRFLIIRIPRSWAGPHMVTYKGTSRFFGRSSAGKFPMDVAEIRSAFALSVDLAERIRRWRDDRLGRIIAEDTPVCLMESARLILHMVPLDSFGDSTHISASSFADAGVKFIPISEHGCDCRLNLDGFLAHGGGLDAARPRSYCQVFRSGSIEAVTGGSLVESEREKLISPGYEQDTLEAVARYLRALADLQVAPPIVILLSFIEVKGARLAGTRGRRNSIDRDIVLLPDVLLDEQPTDLPLAMKPAFDALWNACGFPRSFNYEEDGRWCARPLQNVPMGTGS